MRIAKSGMQKMGVSLPHPSSIPLGGVSDAKDCAARHGIRGERRALKAQRDNQTW